MFKIKKKIKLKITLSPNMKKNQFIVTICLFRIKLVNIILIIKKKSNNTNKIGVNKSGYHLAMAERTLFGNILYIYLENRHMKMKIDVVCAVWTF